MGFLLYEIQLLPVFDWQIWIIRAIKDKKIRDVQVFSRIQIKTAQRSWLRRGVTDEKIRGVYKRLRVEKLSIGHNFIGREW